MTGPGTETEKGGVNEAIYDSREGGVFWWVLIGETIEVLGFTKNQETLQRKDPHEDPGDFFLLLEEFEDVLDFFFAGFFAWAKKVECRK